ncbi:MAG TPA: MFS transporter, partial [Gammaproteobacteria bacterium]|nr:MFS transporter [Gammaproteobacteria bacterium]
GESIYMLPYMRKTFQTSMQAVFHLSGTQIGLLNAMFGVLALICYFPSGWLADRFSARKLLTLSLATTGCGGFFLLTEPSFTGLLAVQAFWGITSILTFWGALIKATRDWGRPDRQGLSFGLLDAGRGVVAALVATLATAAFAHAGSTAAGLKAVIWVYSLAPLLAAVLIWAVVPDDLHAGSTASATRTPGWEGLKAVGALPDVWLLAVVIFSAYMLYLGTYGFPAYAEKAFAETKTFGAVVGTVRDWMRPVAALGAGLLADRFGASRTIGAAFGLLIAAFASLFLITPVPGGLWVLWTQVILAGAAVFALRGIYFAVLEEAEIPSSLTGTTVGIVSFVGFMPDAFAPVLWGWFVDHFEGVLGYRYYFGVLAGVATVGTLAALGIRLLRSPRARAVG